LPPLAVDETGETVYAPRTPVSGPVAIPAPSRSPISSPGLVPALPPAGWMQPDTSTGSRPAVRPVSSYAPPTEPLRIPPARGSGRGVLLVLFVLLTLAAVALGVFLLRGGLDDITGAAAAATVIVSPLAGSVASRDASAPADPRRNRHR
jgi:serine/threonine-protein kinase